MPLFDYRCRRCGRVTEVLIRARQPELPVACGCGSADTVRLVSRFSLGGRRPAKYSEEFRERTLPFLKSRPGAAELLADAGGSEEAAAFDLTERIGERVDAALDQHVFR